MNLKDKISSIRLKYKFIKDSNELIYLLKKEYKIEYEKENILDLTELEIENSKINYGYFNEYQKTIRT